ncbi:hypothetical protein ABFX02_08G105200 [Erythranthe guttata]
MFEILFGWRKASKCKKLVRKVQCRLKLLKNKRVCIVNHLREDVSELLKHGHHLTAFERAEQVIMDESWVQIYDLLHHFSEFILLNFRYIRKHRNCPNDINEAISTLIFSSARFGQLPELVSIRKLFGERYGDKFVTTAIELLPGNLVNSQIKEKLYIKKVSDDAKYKLLDEIGRSFVQQAGPLFLEYKPELQEDQSLEKATKGEVELYIEREAHGNITYTDSYTKPMKEESLALGKELVLSTPIQVSDLHTQERIMSAECNESSSESSVELPDREIVYLDDIEEFISPVSKDGNLQDQRLFVFKSFGIGLKEKTDYGIEEQRLYQEELISRKKKASTKARTRRSSLSRENHNIADIESATYYGVSNKIRSKILLRESQKSDGYLYHCRDENEREDENGGLQLCKYSHTNERGNNGKRELIEVPRLRGLTLPVERPKQSSVIPADNIYRSKSYPFELSNSSCKHIHPKLPDYDELAAKFMELKRANLQRKHQQLNNA